MKINNRINKIEEYHFKILEQIKNERINLNKVVYDLSIGDPDLTIDSSITDALIDALSDKGFNRYPPYDGIDELKKALIDYYYKQFQVQLEEDEISILIGSKEGISNIIPAICDVGDLVLVPQPGYPVYSIASILWGCNYYTIPLKEDKNYLIDFNEIPDKICREAKLMFINYPNNPTGAVGNKEFFSDIIQYCNKNNIVLCNDGAYNEIISPDKKPISLLQFDKEKRTIEFGSFSKIFNMSGFRIGYAVGNKEVIQALIKVKSNLDSGQFIPIQKSALKALTLEKKYKDKIRNTYIYRRKIAEEILKEKNIKFFHTDATFYIWCKVPKGYTTSEFCEELINKYGIIVTPGNVFGNLGYDYFRISLTTDTETLKTALSSLDKFNEKI